MALNGHMDEEYELPSECLNVRPREIIGKSRCTVVAGVLHNSLEVAVKIVGPEEATRYLLKNEIRLCRLISSDYVVKPLGICDWNGSWSLVMERSFTPLSSYTYFGFRLPHSDILTYSICICKGIRDIHAANLVHRDIKPENILLNGNGGVKICDFELLRALPKPGEKTESDEGFSLAYLTRSTKLDVGTFQYKAPELFDTMPGVTQATDIWSFGGVLLAMCTGQPPWPGYSDAQISRAMIRMQTPVIPSCVPAPFASIIKWCHHTEVENRPTAGQLIERFQLLQDALADDPDDISGSIEDLHSQPSTSEDISSESPDASSQHTPALPSYQLSESDILSLSGPSTPLSASPSPSSATSVPHIQSGSDPASTMTTTPRKWRRLIPEVPRGPAISLAVVLLAAFVYLVYISMSPPQLFPPEKNQFWDIVSGRAQIPLVAKPTVVDMLRPVAEYCIRGHHYPPNLNESGVWDEHFQINEFKRVDQYALGDCVASDLRRSCLPYVIMANQSLSESIRCQVSNISTGELLADITTLTSQLPINRDRFPAASSIPEGSVVIVTHGRHDIRFVAPVSVNDSSLASPVWIMPVENEPFEKNYTYYGDPCLKAGKEIKYDKSILGSNSTFSILGSPTTLAFVVADNDSLKVWADREKWSVHNTKGNPCTTVSPSSLLRAVQVPEQGGYVVWGLGFQEKFMELSVNVSDGDQLVTLPQASFETDFLTSNALLLRILPPYSRLPFASVTITSSFGFRAALEHCQVLYEKRESSYHWHAMWDHRYPSFNTLDGNEENRKHTLATRFVLSGDKLFHVPSQGVQRA